MKTPSSPRIIFPEGFDERAAFETPLKGWLNAQIELDEHDVDEAVKSARPCFAEPGLIIVPEVTVKAIQDAVQFLWKQGFFAYLKAEQGEGVGVNDAGT